MHQQGAGSWGPQSVATDTPIRVTGSGSVATPVPVAGVEGDGGQGARDRRDDQCPRPEVISGTVGRSTPISAEVERDAPQPGLRAATVRCLTRTRCFGHRGGEGRGCSVRARGPGPSHGVDQCPRPTPTVRRPPSPTSSADRRRGQGARGVGHRGRVAGPHRPRVGRSLKCGAGPPGHALTFRPAPAGVRDDHCLSAVSDLELGQHVAHMGLGGGLADDQDAGYLTLVIPWARWTSTSRSRSVRRATASAASGSGLLRPAT